MELDKAKIIADEHFKKFNLNDWSFGFNNNKRRFGVCKGNKKRIEISACLTERNEEIYFLDTLLHEIAHALVGTMHKHNQVWRMKAIEIGCCGDRTCSDMIAKPEGRYKYECPNCHNVINQYRRTKPNRQMACKKCCDKFNGGKWKKEYVLFEVKK